METFFSSHALKRSQQRGIPLTVADYLVAYGAEQYDGHGGVIRYFDHKSLKMIKKELSQSEIRMMSDYLKCFLVEGSKDGVVITVGKRIKRVHR